jgi:predicted TIM-barrel fold metal-dependent hydrolase
MMERLAWLARTVEEAIEPNVEICDPHHHLWEFPSNRYLVEEFLADAGGGHRVTRTVHVECHQKYRTEGPTALRPVGETEFVDHCTSALQGATAKPQIAAGIVGFADLCLGHAVREVLEAHLAASKRFRGVRHASAWDASDQIRKAHTDPPAGLLGRAEFRAGVGCLSDLGLTFDAWLYHTQIPEAVGLARAFPELTVVLDHAGGPLGIGPYAGRRDEIFTVWRRAMAVLAGCPNVVVKIGGLAMTMSGFGWHKRDAPPGSIELADSMRPYFTACLELFGAGRCMFESNFPVEQASCSYTVLWNAFKRLARDCSPTERAALFSSTATRVYRLEGPVP